MDYQGNSRKDKEVTAKPKKHIEKVITTEVVIQKRSLGRKFKDIIVEADFKSVTRYVIYDVLIPAARNTIVDASTKGIERMMYGDSAVRRGSRGAGPRITYNNPINRSGPRDMPSVRPSGLTPSESRSPRHNRDDFILSTRAEAELVLERLNDIIDTFEVVSVGDLNELVGFPSSYTDNKWGWAYLGDVQIQQIREGYLINLPSAELIQ